MLRDYQNRMVVAKEALGHLGWGLMLRDFLMEEKLRH